MNTPEQLFAAAEHLARLLDERDRKIVFAESCTGGLVAAVLAHVPGISARLCGSAVVYQVETKAEWLGISRAVLEDPGPVSRQVAVIMAENVLHRTPHADLSASVTGHLGPGAPHDQDGVIHAAVARRHSGGKRESMETVVETYQLPDAPAETTTGTAETLRVRRQRSAAQTVLCLVSAVLEGSTG